MEREKEQGGREGRKEGGTYFQGTLWDLRTRLSKHTLVAGAYFLKVRVVPDCGQISSRLDRGPVILKCPNKPGVVANTCDPSTQCGRNRRIRNSRSLSATQRV